MIGKVEEEYKKQISVTYSARGNGKVSWSSEGDDVIINSTEDHGMVGTAVIHSTKIMALVKALLRLRKKIIQETKINEEKNA